MLAPHLLLRGVATALLAVTTPIALARPAIATDGACVSDVTAGTTTLFPQCCNAPNQWCNDPVYGMQFMKFWYEGSQPCPKF